MKQNDEIYENALKVAHLYYYHGLTTEKIAQEMNFSRPKVSRLLSFARDEGLVEIKIIDKHDALQPLERQILEKYRALDVTSVVTAPENLNEYECLQRVSKFAANYLNSFLTPEQICGISWSRELVEVSKYLIPKKIHGLNFVQLHGNYISNKSGFYSRIIYNFTRNYSAKMTILPVPVFFDYPETKTALWQEQTIKKVLEKLQKASVLIFGVNNITDISSEHLLFDEQFLTDRDRSIMSEQNIIGEISSILYRPNGSYADIALNARSSGPPLDIFKQVKHSICIASGLHLIEPLNAALNAGYINNLIIDEITARDLHALQN